MLNLFLLGLGKTLTAFPYSASNCALYVHVSRVVPIKVVKDTRRKSRVVPSLPRRPVQAAQKNPKNLLKLQKKSIKPPNMHSRTLGDQTDTLVASGTQCLGAAQAGAQTTFQSSGTDCYTSRILTRAHVRHSFWSILVYFGLLLKNVRQAMLTTHGSKKLDYLIICNDLVQFSFPCFKQ